MGPGDGLGKPQRAGAHPPAGPRHQRQQDIGGILRPPGVPRSAVAGPAMAIAGRGSGMGGVVPARPGASGARCPGRAGPVTGQTAPSARCVCPGPPRGGNRRSRAGPAAGGCRCAGQVADDQAGTPLGGGVPGGLPARPAHRVTAMPAFGPQCAGVPGAQFPEGHPYRGRPPGPQVLQGMAQVPGGRYRQGYLVRARPRVSGHGAGQRGVRATTATVRQRVVMPGVVTSRLSPPATAVLSGHGGARSDDGYGDG